MPIEIAPNRIELSDLSGGFTPDPAEAAVGMSGSPEVLNLLPLAFQNELRLRYGFARESAGRVSALSASHYIRHLSYYEVIVSHARKRYIMAVFSNGTNNSANNIRIYAYDLDNNTFTRVDTAGVSWAKAKRDMWSAVVEGTWYFGTRGEAVVSWHPTTGYDATPFTPNVDTWVNSTSPGAGEKAKDYAFKKGNQVLFSGAYYNAKKDNRYDVWDDGHRYRNGNRVSRKATVGGELYWRSYECIKQHTAGTDADQPGTGANTDTYWRKIRLQNILDDDSEVTRDWTLNPTPRKSGVGTYHGGRMWVRDDDDDQTGRVQYSAPAKPEEGAVIADLVWDPTDWAAVDDNEGDGGGWFTVPWSGKADGIRALHSFGTYLIIAGRWQSYVLAGLNESTWTLRKLGNYGALSNDAVCELDGLVYMLSRQGVLVHTDGTQIEPVPGSEKIRKYLKDKIDTVLNTGGDDDNDTDQNWFANVRAHDGYVWISLPVPSGTSITIVYDPRTQSFWKLDLPILAMTIGEAKGVERLWFSTAITGAATQVPTLFRYTDDPGSEAYVDDDWQAVSGSASTTDIPWTYRSAWFQFGMTRNERRIRRAWALVGGEAASTVVVRLFRNFINGSSSYATTVTRTLTGQATRQAEFVEAKVSGSGHPSYAEGIRVSGSANAALSVHGVGIDTEPVRTRYHK